MNYEFNLLNHVGVVGKKVCAAAAEMAAETAAHEGDDNTPSGPTGRGDPFGPNGPRGEKYIFRYFLNITQLSQLLQFQTKLLFLVLSHNYNPGDAMIADLMYSPSLLDLSFINPYTSQHIVASELKDPICHSNECQIGSFSSEATIYINL